MHEPIPGANLAITFDTRSTDAIRAGEETAKIRQLLIDHNAVLVHFSGYRDDEQDPKKRYPFNLRHAIDKLTWNCFSSVRPEHEMDDHWGFVGVIGIPKGVAGIEGVGPSDWGSRRLPSGIIEVPERNGSMELCATILETRKPYDEWVLNAYTAYGFFVFEDHLRSKWRPNQADIRAEFPGCPIYSASNGDFVQLLEDGTTYPVSVEAIYTS